MSLETRLSAFAAAVGDDMQSVIASIGELSTLSTTAKGNIVAAINEVVASVTSGGGASISDGTTSAGSTWSSQRIAQAIQTSLTSFVEGAPAALDTWGELVAELQDQDSAVSGLVTALGNRVRFDAAQSLTTGQQLQACQNIGVGDPEVDLVTAYEAARDAA